MKTPKKHSTPIEQYFSIRKKICKNGFVIEDKSKYNRKTNKKTIENESNEK